MGMYINPGNVCESDALLRATWDLDEETVAAAIEHAHDEGCTHVYYNDEQVLHVVVRAAYISAADHYAKVEELPSGRGLADAVYLPKRGDTSVRFTGDLP